MKDGRTLGGSGRVMTSTDDTSPRPALTRRMFLRLAGLAGLAGAASAAIPNAALATTRVRRWSKPGTWGPSGVPGPGDLAVLSGPVLLDVDATVRGVNIQPGGRLIFHPWRS